MPNRVLAFVRRSLGFDVYQEPPPVVRESPNGYVLFMDESEQQILYSLKWPHTGLPHDDRNRRAGLEWEINGQYFCPARREGGNWIFRRCTN